MSSRRHTAGRAGALGLVALLAGGVGVAAASPASSPPTPQTIVIRAEPGQGDVVARALRSEGHRIDRRKGPLLQVVAPARVMPALERLPGVAHVEGPPQVFPDATAKQARRTVQSQGLQRSGAAAFLERSRGGVALKIAVLDLGFGRSIARFQNAGELPPPQRLLTRSFDAAGGLAGANAYGNPTNHGELVAQTIYDYAPNASYIFANYRTQLDFEAAVAWLIEQRPDIVVHSNSILEGPFDGTGPYARMVDQAAANGILWFNSAGNYARRHWKGPFSDLDGNGVHDWPHPGGWIFFRPRGRPISFALSWNSPPGQTTDLDMALDTLEPGNTWRTVAESRRPQGSGAPNSEKITGYTGSQQGFYRLRVWRAGGPPPEGDMTLFSREIPTSPIGGSPVSSQPTPGDARGAVSVGAVDWRGDVLKDYSSNGPTVDGRMKPDLVAPTNTRVAGPRGVRAVGGTSNAAPNAAGAAAVLLGRFRARGLTPTAADIKALMMRDAVDLGEEGPDNQFGAGRVRVDTAPPRITRIRPRPGSDVSGAVRLSFQLAGRSQLIGWSFLRNGERVGRERRSSTTSVRVDTRRLEDGWHTLGVSARDWPGNVREREWRIRVDNTPPVLAVGDVGLHARGRRSRVAVPIRVRDDVTTGRIQVRLRVVRAGGGTVIDSVRRLPQGARRVPVGTLAPGRYELRVVARDRAGNGRGARRAFTVPARGSAAA